MTVMRKVNCSAYVVDNLIPSASLGVRRKHKPTTVKCERSLTLSHSFSQYEVANTDSFHFNERYAPTHIHDAT